MSDAKFESLAQMVMAVAALLTISHGCDVEAKRQVDKLRIERQCPETPRSTP